MVDAIESRLNENQWLGGQQPTKEDATAFADLAGKLPSADTHPNAFAWASLVSRFTDAVRGTWPEGGAPAKEGVSCLNDHISDYQFVPIVGFINLLDSTLVVRAIFFAKSSTSFNFCLMLLTGQEGRKEGEGWQEGRRQEGGEEGGG